MEGETFDHIVVGAGSAGCVLANRLSADPHRRVCLIEAGPDDRKLATRIKVDVPVGNVSLLKYAKYNWQHSFTGAANLLGRAIPCPRGRILGGSSAVNGMIYIRGHRNDYDGWAALGCDGWSWDEVLPYFMRHEHRERGGALHGQGGELNVAPLRSLHPASAAFVEAATQLQLRRNEDFNGEEQDGVGPYEVTQKNGERWSSARAFLHPVRHRPNLTILTGALALKLRIENRRATGLTIRHEGATRTLASRGDIVLCGGAINSPQLLMLSGIGPAPALASLGIEIVQDLPGVGQNFQDHASVFVTLDDPTGTSFALTRRALPGFIRDALRYALARQGRLTSNVVEAGGFVRSRPEEANPDLQLIFMPAIKDQRTILPRRHGFSVHAVLLRPQSRGHLALRSPDPADRPALHPNFLDNDDDTARLVHGLKLMRRILAAPAFDRYRGAELTPGPAIVTDEALADYARHTCSTIFHPVGTCKMGAANDAEAVLDPQLRVRGIENLRVADASIMPTIVSGNTNAPCMMIGERCAAWVRAA